MIADLHTIKAAKGSRRKSKRVGRGNASQKGTTAGRGTKGQRARSGGKSGTARRGFKQSLQKVPKLRGFKSMRPKKEVVTLFMLNKIVKAGDIVTPWYLKKKGVIDKPKFGVKVVATGKIMKPITLKNCLTSKMAASLIEKAGGKLIF